MKKLAVVLLSGGLDSTTAASLAGRDGYDVLALTLHYGQVHSKEIEAAKAVAEALHLKHRVVDVEFFGDLAWYSALTSPERFKIPKERQLEEMADDIPITYVPLRNTFFLALGTAWLESEVLRVVEEDGENPADVEAAVFIAANAIDYSGYPDCRPEYYKTVTETLLLGSKMGTQYGISIKIETPLLEMSKADIVRTAVDIGAPLDRTWSCYEGRERPCGVCDSCLLRATGFEEAGAVDPAMALA